MIEDVDDYFSNLPKYEDIEAAEEAKAKAKQPVAEHETDEPRQPVDGAGPDDEGYGERVRKRIAKMTAKTRAAEATAVAERNRAAQLENEIQTLRQQVMQRQMADTQSAVQFALQNGDAAKAAAGQAEMAQIAARMQAPQQATAQQYTPATQAWIAENPWFHTDVKAKGAAISAHTDALASGLKPETPEYFAFVEDRVARRFPQHFAAATEVDEAEDEEAQPVRRRAAGVAPVAPARRAAVGVPGTKASNRLPSLNADEMALVRRMGIKPEDYAANKLKLMQQKAAR